MFQAYIDESGSGQGDLFVLAGYIASAENWAERFSPRWQQIRNLGPPNHRAIQAFKMSEMLDDPERSSWFYRVIEESIAAEVSCVISLSELYSAYREFPWPFRFVDADVFTNPYYFGFQAIIKLLALKQRQLGIDEPIDFVFDDRAEKTKCLLAWDAMKRDPSPEIRDLLGGTPIFRDDKTTLPLQAADMLAYWAREWSYQGVLGDLNKMNFPWERRRKIPGAAFRLTKQTFTSVFKEACEPETLDRLFKEAAKTKTGQIWPVGSTMKFMDEPSIANKENLQSVYSNNISTIFTMFDIRLLFSEIIPDGKGGAENELRAHVVLTPANARSLATLLSKTVDNYESKFGKIEQPNPVDEKRDKL